MKKLILTIIILLASLISYGQEWRMNVDCSGHLSAGTGEYLPFWQRTYEGGIMPYSSSGVVTAGADISYAGSKGFFFDAGANLAGSLALRNPVHGTQVRGMVDRLYVSGGWKMLHLDLGKKPRTRELGDLAISGGNLVMSGYARNIPGINAWIDWIHFEKNRFIAIKGNFAHYQMNDLRYIQDAMIHNKAVAVKFGFRDIVTLEAGLDHWVQWGGVSPISGQMPDSFKDLIRVMFGGNGGADATLNDQLNALGNHLGREYVRLSWNHKDFSLKAQYDMIYDDGNNIIQTQTFPDGVWSLALSLNKRNALVTDLIYEYVHTTWQSGDAHDRPATEEEMTKDYGKYVHWQDPEHCFYGLIVLGGLDNYFNNGEYLSGWTYHGTTIGLPLLLPNAPSEDGITYGIASNRVRAHHFGIKGFVAEVPYTIKATYSSNWGTYFNPTESLFNSRPKQLSLALEVGLRKQVTKLPVDFAVGAYCDFGKLYQNSVGLSLRVLYNYSKVL